MSSGVSYIPLESPIEVLEAGIDAYALNNLEDADPMYIGKAVRSAQGWSAAQARRRLQPCSQATTSTLPSQATAA